MLTPAGLWRRVVERARTRDPESEGLRRAVRAAIVVPIAAAVSFAVADNAQTPLFTLFGSVALMVMADFPGNRQNRALAYAGLAINGAVLISLGSLVAGRTWIAVLAMFVIGVAVTFSGVLSETIAAGQRPTLVTFVLPACTPPGPLSDRLFGWLIALAVCVPAALFLLPPRHHGQLRRRAARVCALLADRLDGTATPEEVGAAMDKLRATFLGADFRPVGLSAGSRALVRVVDDLEWVAERIGIAENPAGAALLDMKEPAVRVLRASAALLRITRIADRAPSRAELDAALDELTSAARGRYREDIETILGARTDADATELGRELLSRRTVAATIGATGRIVAAAAAADARPVWARALGLRLPPTAASYRLLPEAAAAAQITTGLFAYRSVAVRNSLRTGLGLAVAVAVTNYFPVQNGMWVVLGALSVLRSSALSTGTRLARAVAGTIAGFLLGAALIALVGVDHRVMWVLMPVVVFGSAYVPKVASFAAAQAAFTMMVLIFFNLNNPIGWHAGLIRVEDVMFGALVAAVVSLLMWPRGASATVSRAIQSAQRVYARYLRVAVGRITGGAFEARADEVVTLGHDSLAAARMVDDAVRQYLSESSGETDYRAPIVRASHRAFRIRAAADLIADIPTPPPLTAYPAARAVLESHTDTICTQLADGSAPDAVPVPISDELVPALRAESSGDELAVSAALPLVAVAASLGELELIYHRPTDAETVSG